MIEYVYKAQTIEFRVKNERIGNALKKYFSTKGEKIMKKRRNIIISLLLVAALALGIGYAMLSRELIISSTANLAPDENDFDVIFTEAEPRPEYATLATASVTGMGKGANYTITGLSAKGDKVVLDFTIKNNTADVTAYLYGVSQNAGNLYVGDGTENPGVVSDYFSKDVVITNDETGATYKANEAFTIAPGKTATVTITVELLKTVTEKVTLDGASVHLNFQDAGSVSTTAASN